MYLKSQMNTSIESFSKQIENVRGSLEKAEAIIIGAGAGLSESAGLTYSNERFERYFSDFGDKYGITDMYSGGFYPFESQEEYWAWWSRHIYYNRYDAPVGKPYCDLLRLLGEKDYFVITTNVDHQFQKSGFNKKRLFYTQGDYGLWQCSGPCQQKTYDNEGEVLEMLNRQRSMKIPSDLIPHCPECGRPMVMNLRSDDRFVEDEGWHNAAGRYSEFIGRCRNRRIVLLELGVGGNTPGIIKYPFWLMAAENPEATYICINKGEAICPQIIETRSICLNADIGDVFGRL